MTTAGAVRAAVARAACGCDRLAGRFRRARRVLVEVRTPMNLAVLKPVILPLLDDPRLDVRFTGGDRADLVRAYTELGVAGQVLPRRQARWTRVDLYVNADPWEAVPLFRAQRQLNFFHGVAGKYDLDCPSGLPMGFDRYDRVAFPNAGRRDRYVAAGIVAPDRAALIGYPKADALVAAAGDARTAAAALGLDPARPTAIFAPTFSPASALNVAGGEIIQTLLASGCNVIAKLHDRSLDADPRYSGGVNWRDRLDRHTGPRFRFADTGDSTSWILASDLMVTDHSSIGFEFCALDRPLIVFDVPELVEVARINLDKVNLLRSAAAIVGDSASLAAAVKQALAAPEERSPQRRHVAAQVFYRPGTATARALGLVYELLNLAPAADLVMTPPRQWLSTAE